MGKLFRKLLIEEVALAGNPVNGEKFILIKDGGLDMNDRIKLASLLLIGEDVPEVVKEEMKKFLPKEGDSLVLDKDIKVTVKKDAAYDIETKGVSEEEKEKLEKFDELKKDLDNALAELAKIKGEDPKALLKDVPQVIKDRLEKLEKDVTEAKKREAQLKKDAIQKDIAIKVGEPIAKDIMGIYEEGKEAEIDAIVNKIAGMQKMLKDLGQSMGKKSDEDIGKLISEGVAKIKKERGIESDTDAYVEFCKENPELCMKKED